MKNIFWLILRFQTDTEIKDLILSDDAAFQLTYLELVGSLN